MGDDNAVGQATDYLHGIVDHAVNNWQHQAVTSGHARVGLASLSVF